MTTDQEENALRQGAGMGGNPGWEEPGSQPDGGDRRIGTGQEEDRLGNGMGQGHRGSQISRTLVFVL